ncbi:MAG: hypothetical protein ACHQ2Y_02345 [Candidatus Lutacidiplasmatales archaeon]
MADLEGFTDLIWERIGPEVREMVRESWKVTHELGPELQPKVYACFLWVTWLRGTRGMPQGRPDFWDHV